MARKSVVDYINGLLKKGYDISTIKNVMLKYGYTNNDIDEALKEVYHPTIRHEIHLSKTTIFVVILILVSAIGAAFFLYYNPQKSQTKLLDLNLEPVKTTAKAGESIAFLKELANLGSSKRYDVVIKQEIIDPKTYKQITEKTETRAIETFGSTQTNLQIPEGTKEGDYILRAIIEYDGKKAVATLPIKVLAGNDDKCFDGIKNQDEASIDCGGVCKPCEKALDCNDSNPCTEDKIEDGRCSNNPIAPCCGNKICEEQEENCAEDCKKESPAEQTLTLEDIREIAKSDPGRAYRECNKLELPDSKDACIANIGEMQRNKAYCGQVNNPRVKDLCYSNIAKLTNDNSLCDKISIDSRKDSCYMTFVLDNKDYSVCNKINNTALRQSCESLRQLYELNHQQKQQENPQVQV